MNPDKVYLKTLVSTDFQLGRWSLELFWRHPYWSGSVSMFENRPYAQYLSTSTKLYFLQAFTLCYYKIVFFTSFYLMLLWFDYPILCKSLITFEISIIPFQNQYKFEPCQPIFKLYLNMNYTFPMILITLFLTTYLNL